MAISTTYYGSVDEANTYFGSRLHADAWTNALASDYPKALLQATQIIDTLNYKGHKNAVYLLLQQYPYKSELTAFDPFVEFTVQPPTLYPGGPTFDQLRAAEASQPLEFPRGSDTEVPDAIRMACYEIAFSLLDGKDPEMELENLAVVSQGYSSVRTTYSRTQVPQEHLINGVPSAAAWRLLRPFLRDGDALKLKRVS